MVNTYTYSIFCIYKISVTSLEVQKAAIYGRVPLVGIFSFRRSEQLILRK